MIISVYWIMEKRHKKIEKKIEHEVEKDVHIDNHQTKLIEELIKLIKNMPTKEQFDAAFARIDAALSEIETTVSGTVIPPGLSTADQDAILAKLESTADNVERIEAIKPTV